MLRTRYGAEYGHGLLMASAERISVRGNIAAGLLHDYGHHDMQLLRDANDVARRFGLPVPYPDVPALGEDTGERFGLDYFNLEVPAAKRRRCGNGKAPMAALAAAEAPEAAAAAPPPKFAVPTPEPYLAPWTHVFAEEPTLSAAELTALFSVGDDEVVAEMVRTGEHSRRSAAKLCPVGGACCHMWKRGGPCSGAKHKPGLHKHTTDCPQGKGNALSLAMKKRLGTTRK